MSALSLTNNTTDTIFYQKVCYPTTDPNNYDSSKSNSYSIDPGVSNHSAGLKKCGDESKPYYTFGFYPDNTDGTAPLYYLYIDSNQTFVENNNQGFFNKKYSFDFDSDALTLTINDSNNGMLIGIGIGTLFIILVTAAIYAIYKKHI